ncbi:MAG: saccharopine dehydrogenase NADP-binding domain-containing protein, partial [Fibrobacter sp.]|nr:saccharopine dehydrogenase NADP-binding domain-containing protein [Fibrobacter sp.]
MARALIIGCGAVATVAIKKCCTASEVFSEICIASRHRENCEKLA